MKLFEFGEYYDFFTQITYLCEDSAVKTSNHCSGFRLILYVKLQVYRPILHVEKLRWSSIMAAPHERFVDVCAKQQNTLWSRCIDSSRWKWNGAVWNLNNCIYKRRRLDGANTCTVWCRLIGNDVLFVQLVIVFATLMCWRPKSTRQQRWRWANKNNHVSGIGYSCRSRGWTAEH